MSIEDTLQTAYEKLTNGDEKKLKPGDLAMWKPGLMNRKIPKRDEPVIVIDVLDVPVIDNTQESGSTYFHEQLNMLAGRIDGNGDLVCYYYELNRFMPYSAE